MTLMSQDDHLTAGAWAACASASKLTRTEQENEITPSSSASFFLADFHSVITYRYLARMIEY